jgi:hypothetical protein
MAAALQRGQKSFNARFAAARMGGAVIDGDAVLAHLRDVVAPIVQATANAMPERVDGVLNALFDVSLELFAASLLGPGSKSPAVVAVWTGLLPVLTKHLSRDPKVVAAAMSNGVYRIAQTSGARPNEWIDAVKRIGPKCESVGELLDVGKVAAWQAGMPHYRKGAIGVAKSLRPALAGELLGVAAEQSCQLLDRMLHDPWFTPQAPINASELRRVRTIGAFRGFGGEFLCPPTVWASGSNLFVGDSESKWQLYCDCFGSILLRHDGSSRERAIASDLMVRNDGLVEWDGANGKFPELAGAISGFACDGKTLAITLTTSHHVFLFARGAHAA